MRPYALSAVVWLAQCLHFVHTRGKSSLVQRTTVPAPISIAPSQQWEGDDGPWSSFSLRVGTPPQNVRVLISTASQETWVVVPQGCIGEDPVCTNIRGGSFNLNTSSTWQYHGYYQLYIERNLNYTGNAEFGNDTVGLGPQGGGGPTLENQIVGGYATPEFLIGFFGINPKPTNFTGLDNGQASYMATLKDQNLIPSLSFGYTAGAQYRLKEVFGSLTLGGYDLSRFTTNNMSFSFAPDNSRDLVLGIQSITSTNLAGNPTNLLSQGILAYIDSTVPHIWLPIYACQAFEDAFGLTYDNSSELYLVNDTQHKQLLAHNASITFALGNAGTGGNTIEMVFPYASFDLVASWPLFANSTRYFPLRRAENDTQYTLGRTFLQETYLTVDWEQSNFSVSQCLFNDNMQEDLVAIQPAKSTTNSNPTSTNTPTTPVKKSSSSGKTIGIAVGVVIAVLVVLSALAIYFLLPRWRRNRRSKQQSSQSTSDSLENDKTHQRFPKADAELAAGKVPQRYELIGDHPPEHEDITDIGHQPYTDDRATGDHTRSELKGDGVYAAELSGPKNAPQNRHELSESSILPPVELRGDFPPGTRTSNPPHGPQDNPPPQSPSPMAGPSSPISRSKGPSPINASPAPGDRSSTDRHSRPPLHQRQTTMDSAVSDQSLPSQLSEFSPSNAASAARIGNDPISPLGRNGSQGSRNMFSMLKGFGSSPQSTSEEHGGGKGSES